MRLHLSSAKKLTAAGWTMRQRSCMFCNSASTHLSTKSAKVASASTREGPAWPGQGRAKQRRPVLDACLEEEVANPQEKRSKKNQGETRSTKDCFGIVLHSSVSKRGEKQPDHGWPESITARRSFARKFFARCGHEQRAATNLRTPPHTSLMMILRNDSHDYSAQ